MTTPNPGSPPPSPGPMNVDDPESAVGAAAPLLSRDCATLRRLEAFLAVLGFHHAASRRRLLLSGAAYLLLGVAAPAAVVILSRCDSDKCVGYRVERFEVCLLVFEAVLAAVSLTCMSWNLWKYGVRKFLFVDQHHGQAERFQKEYAKKIQDFYYLLLWWILPCFLVKVSREIIHFANIYHTSVWKSVVVLVASTLSWIYLTTVFLSACALFSLVCSLQVIHFDDYGKLLERDVDTFMFLEEHMRLRYYLSKISHRFRALLLCLFLLVTASQVVTLFLITGYKELVNFSTAGDLIVSSVVQLVGVVLCLHAAAKISHRAQSIASIACRWHAWNTCSSTGSSQLRLTSSSSNLENISTNALSISYSESDLDSLDNIPAQTNTQTLSASHLTSYHKRQALVLYLQSNLGGITIFGWMIDRGLLNTLFFIEMSLVTFVLGKTIAFSAT